MANAPTQTATSNPAPASVPAEEWRPPDEDQEFVFEGIDKAPAWVDKGWASFKQGPALALPAGDILGWTGPYHTKFARLGDTVVFKATSGARPAHFEVIEGDPIEAGPARKPPQQSPAQLEDLLKLGYVTGDEIGEDAKQQVLARSPGMKRLVEEGIGAAKKQSISEQILTD